MCIYLSFLVLSFSFWCQCFVGWLCSIYLLLVILSTLPKLFIRWLSLKPRRVNLSRVHIMYLRSNHFQLMWLHERGFPIAIPVNTGLYFYFPIFGCSTFMMAPLNGYENNICRIICGQLEISSHLLTLDTSPLVQKDQH